MEGAMMQPKSDKSNLILAPKLAKKTKKTNARKSIKVNVGRSLNTSFGKK